MTPQELAERLRVSPRTGSAGPPDSAGVYIFRDGRKHPIYIGKALSRADRLSSSRASNLPDKTAAMIAAARSVDWIVFQTEMEALLCEAAMVRQYKPKYNILLRDDKRFPMILLTDEPYPKALKVRRARKGAGRHFGPFGGSTAFHLLEIISRRFKIRRCGGPLPKRDRPCIDHEIGRCDAPCVGSIGRAEYGMLVESAAHLLAGDVRALARELEEEMRHASSEKQFEKAASLRDEVAALKSVLEKQNAEKPGRDDADAVAVEIGDSFAVGVVLSRRNGAVVDRAAYVFETPIETDADEILAKTASAHYEQHAAPPEILVPKPVSMPGRVYRVPMRGPDAALLKLADDNARETLRDVSGARGSEVRNRALVELAEALGMENAPRTIEGIDIATFAGKDTVGACVHFHDALPRKAGYRLFRIRGRQDSDVDAIEEVMARRMHLKEPWPDLFLIDGGMGQLLAAFRALEESARERGIVAPAIVSLEKRDELIRTVEGEVIELPRHAAALKLLQHVRDEAHRFGGNYHRKIRGSSGGLARTSR